MSGVESCSLQLPCDSLARHDLSTSEVYRIEKAILFQVQVLADELLLVPTTKTKFGSARLIQLQSSVFNCWKTKPKQSVAANFIPGDLFDVDIVETEPGGVLYVVKIYSLRRTLTLKDEHVHMVRGTGLVLTVTDKRRVLLRSELLPRDTEFTCDGSTCPDFADINLNAKDIFPPGTVCLFECRIEGGGSSSPSSSHVIVCLREMRLFTEILNFRLVHCFGKIVALDSSSCSTDHFTARLAVHTDRFGPMPIPRWPANCWELPSAKLVGQLVLCTLAPKMPQKNAQDDLEVIFVGPAEPSYGHIDTNARNINAEISEDFRRSLKFTLMPTDPYPGLCSREASKLCDLSCTSMDATWITADFFKQAKDALLFLAERTPKHVFERWCDENEKFVQLTICQDDIFD